MNIKDIIIENSWEMETNRYVLGTNNIDTITNEVLKEITELENQSFEGWSDDAINGYLTACKTIKEKL